MLASAAFLLLSLAPLQDETVQDFKRFYRRTKDPVEKVEIIHSLEGLDTPEVARVLQNLLADSDKAIADAALIVITRLPSPEARAPLLRVLEKGKPVEILAAVVRAAGAGKWHEYGEAIRPLLEHKDPTVRLWAAVAPGLLGDPATMEALSVMVVEDDETAVRVAAVDSLASLGLGREARAAPALVSALEDPTLEVKTAACLALKRVRTTDAVGPLIRILAEEKGRILEQILPTLYELTDLQLGDDPEAWVSWWTAAQDRAYRIPSAEELRKRREAREATASIYQTARPEAEFIGIPTPSRKVVFVIDISGSMEEEVVDQQPFRERGFTRFRKLDIVQEELARSIEGLGPEVRFNLFAFATEIHPWRKKLVPANALNRRSATAFVRGLQPLGGAAAAAAASAGLQGSAGEREGMTNTYAALLAGLGIKNPDKLESTTQGATEFVKGSGDTLFFLSDGRPSVGELVDPDDILEAVLELNRFRRVVVHTIAIGEFQKDFMEFLARDTGGIFMDLGR